MLLFCKGFEVDATVVYRCPTPAELARWLDDKLRGGSSALTAVDAPLSLAAATEPVAIVGMACRLPGRSVK